MADDLLNLIEPAEVRAALDPTGLLIDASSLPTPTIQRKVFAGAAVSEVLVLDPDAGTRQDEAQKRIANALNLLTAAYIAPFVTQITREKYGDLDTTYASVDWAGRGAELRGHALAEIREVTGESAAPPAVPRIFGLACGRRGR